MRNRFLLYHLFVGILMISVMTMAGCSDGDNAQTSATSTGSITADAAGTVPAGTTVSPPAGVTSMTFTSSSIMTDSANAPITGAITTTVTRSTSVSSLPAAAPAGTSLAVLLDIDMSKGTTKVKNFSTPMTVILAVPTGVTSVDVYSFNGTNWVPEHAGVVVSGGSASFTVTHLSIWGCFTKNTLTISTTSPLPAGTVGTAYNQTLAASGGTAPYTWTVAAGSSLPAGLALSSAGVISGTPTTAGTVNANITVTDAAAVTATKVLSITVNAAGAALSITTASLSAAIVGTAYNQTLAATGGTGAYTWSVFAGTLPVGLSLNSTSGVISGTPTTAGTSSVTFRVTDAAATTANAALSITVNPAGASVPAAPVGVVATGGTNSVSISWPAVTGATSYNIYWSATTGVTTATGTKITGATSPTRHSRLSATPTWLAASTPYFYIVTAVNASGESTASAQVSATTSAVDGVSLYTTNCSSCHNPLATTNKPGRTATATQNAINANTGQMGTLSVLTPPQVQAIADVLATGF